IDCHATRTARWAADAVARRYGPTRRREWHYGEALHAARAGRPDTEAQLARAIEEAGVPAIVRATALSELPPYLGPRSRPLVERALEDGEPLVRRAALDAVGALDPATRIRLAVPRLDDPVRTVRLEALSVLLDVPRDAVPREHVAALDRAIAE